MHRTSGIALGAICLVWLAWAVLVIFATGSLIPQAPVDAQDEIDLLFWACLQIWTYITPLALIAAWFLSKRQPSAAMTVALGCLVAPSAALILHFMAT